MNLAVDAGILDERASKTILDFFRISGRSTPSTKLGSINWTEIHLPDQPLQLTYQNKHLISDTDLYRFTNELEFRTS